MTRVSDRPPPVSERPPPVSERPRRPPPLDDLDDDDRPNRRPSRRRGSFGSECHSCGSDAPPIYTSQISAGGWIVMVVMLVFCWPLFWIGLLMKEDVKKCSECGARL